MLLLYIKTLQFLYSAVSGPQNCSNQFTTKACITMATPAVTQIVSSATL